MKDYEARTFPINKEFNAQNVDLHLLTQKSSSK